MNTNDTILFNVNDRLGKVVDYSHISCLLYTSDAADE